MRESSYFIKLRKEVYKALYPRFRSMAFALLSNALTNKEHGDLTGNTVTSFTAGIYENGTLIDTINIMEVANLNTPEYSKLSNDMGVVSIERYDNGNLIQVDTSKLMKTDRDYGFKSAESFLSSYTPKTTIGWSVVITTGTEYSEYIETVRNLNVLTETFLQADFIVNGILR